MACVGQSEEHVVRLDDHTITHRAVHACIAFTGSIFLGGVWYKTIGGNIANANMSICVVANGSERMTCNRTKTDVRQPFVFCENTPNRILTLVLLMLVY